jgi:hypothetical protein
MINLKHEVRNRGFYVAHIKTDSIKVPDATPEIIEFIMNYGKKYGYNFEHEATYDKMCLVNDAVYIAKYASKEKCEELYGYCPGDNKKHGNEWTATGTQFAVPYVFKKLFSREDITFEDMCETKSVTGSLYLDMNENLPDVTAYEKELESLIKQARKVGVEIDTSVPMDDELSYLLQKIAQGHNYKFVGKVGQFCPIKPDCGGGVLLRETTNNKTGEKGYAAATGSKGYRWLESEMVKELGKESDIDRSYYDLMVDTAVVALSNYGGADWFRSDTPYDEFTNEILPF